MRMAADDLGCCAPKQITWRKLRTMPGFSGMPGGAAPPARHLKPVLDLDAGLFLLYGLVHEQYKKSPAESQQDAPQVDSIDCPKPQK